MAYYCFYMFWRWSWAQFSCNRSFQLGVPVTTLILFLFPIPALLRMSGRLVLFPNAFNLVLELNIQLIVHLLHFAFTVPSSRSFIWGIHATSIALEKTKLYEQYMQIISQLYLYILVKVHPHPPCTHVLSYLKIIKNIDAYSVNWSTWG